MRHFHPRPRSFLFLQGPPGPFFWELGKQIRQRGCDVHRINLNGGDSYDWPGPSANYRGRRSRWTLFIDGYMRDNAITDLVLFGDCRPMHRSAHQMAKLRGIAVHVFEEGYIRPNWVTLEPDGVNGNSTLSRDASWFVREAAKLPPIPDLPPITASFKRRARDAYWYYHRVVVGRLLLRFPFYRAHRPGSLILEGIGWARKFVRRRFVEQRTEAVLARIAEAPFFLFPLQLSADYQIRTHSPFDSMQEAADYVMQSFAAHAPQGVRLLVKEHPLDSSMVSWRRFVERRARALGVSDRLLHIAGGDLAVLARQSLGMVTVNSTSATFALAAGTPVIALGNAIYAMRGITHQGRLDDFWQAPQRPDATTYEAFRRVLHDRCLVRGGFASQSATAILVEGTIARLFGDPAHAAPFTTLAETSI